MNPEYSKTTLKTIGGGVAAEFFERELKRVVKNIADPNTDPKAKRKITIEITMTADEERRHCAVSVSAHAKLASVMPKGSSLVLVNEGGNTTAYHTNYQQMELTDNVVSMEKTDD